VVLAQEHSRVVDQKSAHFWLVVTEDLSDVPSGGEIYAVRAVRMRRKIEKVQTLIVHLAGAGMVVHDIW